MFDQVAEPDGLRRCQFLLPVIDLPFEFFMIGKETFKKVIIRDVILGGGGFQYVFKFGFI